MSKSWLGRVALRRVTIHLDSGQSFEGNVVEESLDGVLLRSAILLGDPVTGEKPTPLPGETWVPRERVIFAQDVGQ